MEKGQQLIFEYTGNVQEVVLEPGEYLLECWGANGGGTITYPGGTGGYSKINYTTNTETTLFCIVGEGGTGKNMYSSFNGGGCGCTGYLNGFGSYKEYGGGGATHIATANRGELKNYENYKDEVLIVAGAGGGTNQGTGQGSDSIPSCGGNGGGVTGTGSQGAGSADYRGGNCGTQTAGGVGSNTFSFTHGTFGQGGHSKGSGGTNPSDYSGGGGGWYGGAAGKGGGGGSGYIGKNAGLTATVSETGFVENPNTTGNGFIRITYLAAEKQKIKCLDLHGLKHFKSRILATQLTERFQNKRAQLTEFLTTNISGDNIEE